MNNPLYTVIFADGSHYKGGSSYFKTGWNQIPNKNISRIFYNLPTKDYLILTGYESYYHMVEATQDWMKMTKKGLNKSNSEPNIEYAYIMGLKKNKVTVYKITLFGKNKGNIEKQEYNKNDNFILGLNIEGWK